MVVQQLLPSLSLATIYLSAVISHNYLFTECAIFTHFSNSHIDWPVFTTLASATEWVCPLFSDYLYTAKSKP